jgi:uncharacterized membrane protein YjjB (DUF3815 family)
MLLIIRYTPTHLYLYAPFVLFPAGAASFLGFFLTFYYLKTNPILGVIFGAIVGGILGYFVARRRIT